MKFPNKVIPYRQSVISKFPIILKELETQDWSVLSLYRKQRKNFSSLQEYIDTLDCLFFLGRIELLPGGVKLHYVKGSSL